MNQFDRTSSTDSGELEKDVSKLGQEAKNKLGEMAAPLTEKITEAAEAKKTAGAERAAELGGAIHRAADALGKEMPQAAGYIHSAAERLEGASSTLRERSVEDLLGTFSRFARTQPTMAFAGSVLAGVALSRFLKSSSPGREPQ